MSLSVPPVATSVTTPFVPHSYALPHVNLAAANTEPVGIDAHLDISRRELIFEKAKTSPVQIGNWIVVSAVGEFIAAYSKKPFISILMYIRPPVRALPC
jgi:hypothetical protein